MSGEIGPLPSLPDEAYDLHVLSTEVGWSWWYRAHLERNGADSLRLMVETAWRLGYVYCYRQADADDLADPAVLDILDINGDIVHDLAIPHDEALSWWKRAAELRCYESHAEPVP